MGISESKDWTECDIKAWDAEVLDNLQNEVKQYRKKKLNILLFGRTGQGKSAFVNTVYSALHGIPRTIAPEALGCAGLITQGVKKYPLKELEQSENWNLSLLDMQGLESSDDEDKMKVILDYVLEKGDFPQKDSKTLSDGSPVHAMVVCNEFKDNFKLCDDDIRTYVEHTCKKGIPVFLLITRIDVANKKDFKIQSIFSDKDMLTATKEAAKKIGIPEKNVLLQLNYHGVNHLTNKIDIDILTLHNLRFILSNILK